MKRSNLGLVYLAILIAVAVLSSCTSARRGFGCPGQGSGMGFIGYK